MKPVWKELMLAVFLGLVLPWMILNMMLHFREHLRQEEPKYLETEQTEPSTAVQTVALTMYLRRSDGSVTEMDMDTYLTGVILAELPASFEQEAKKAQSVAARTFTWKAVTTGGKHGDGSVCDDSTCCQAYIAPEEYLLTGGSQAAIDAAWEAVTATSGYVLTYQGSLIEATYFSCSGGTTEDAVAVWGRDFPYLRATASPGEEGAAHYTDTVTFTAEQFLACLGVQLTGKPSSWIGVATYTAGGGIATLEIGGRAYKGTELRSLLGLKSTAFTMNAEGETVTVTTRGYGHRVGMSQYGADAMAVSGSTYDQILAHYYRGTELTRLEEN